MFGTVEIPVWLLVLILLFAAVTFASHFLFPSVRWFLRRRMERVVAKLNERLERPIQPFKLANRVDTIQRLIYDPKVMEAVAEHARETGLREDVAFQKARRYAREIVPGFSASAYFGFATRMARWFSTKLFVVELDHHDEAALAAIDEKATIVFVMNHRSNLDYVLVTYLAAERSALSYAVGEWARIWPLTMLIRAMGAYFIRRKSRNALYRRVLSRYVQMATAEGVNQAIFPEGGLTLNGRVGQPKLGLLSYLIAGFDPSGPDIVFVPVAINYDRVVEDRLLIEAQRTGIRKFRGTVPSGLRFTARYVWRRIRRKAQRFGFAAVSFGMPLSLAELLGDPAGDPAVRVGRELMSRIVATMPIVPVPLLAEILKSEARPVSAERIDALVAERVDRLSGRSNTVHLVNGSVEQTRAHALRHLSMRHLVVERDGHYAISDGAGDVIAFYAASVEQVLNAGAEPGLGVAESAET